MWEIEAADSAGRMFNVYQDHEFWGVMNYGWRYGLAARGVTVIDLDTGQPWRPEV